MYEISSSGEVGWIFNVYCHVTQPFLSFTITTADVRWLLRNDTVMRGERDRNKSHTVKRFVRVFERSGFVQSGSFLNTRDGWEQRFNLASWKSQCPRKPWENLSWETCQTKRMATWMERYVPSAKRRRWRYDYISDYECIFNHPVSHAGNKQEHWKKLQDAKTRLGGTTMQIGTLSKDVFERRTSTGSEAFSLSVCLDANKLVLLSFFSLLKTIYPRVSTKPLPNDAKSPLPADVRRSKTLLLKLPNKRTCPLYKPRSCRSDR